MTYLVLSLFPGIGLLDMGGGAMPFADQARKRAYDAARYASRKEVVKACVAAHREANRERIAARQAEYRALNKDRIAVRDAERYQREREARNTANLVWRAENPQARAAHVRRWKDANPDKGREYKHRRKARLRGASSPREIYERDCWLCGICGQPITLGEESLDHIKPVSKGGYHTRGNVRAAHRTCNRNRGNRE